MRDNLPPVPVKYGQSYLVSLVKNIHWLYVFWELAPEEIDLVGEGRMILRLFKGKEPIQQQIMADVTITDSFGSQYLYLAEPGQFYQVQLAVVNSREVVPLLSSNLVFTPFGKVSDQEDTKWASVDELYQEYSGCLTMDTVSSPELSYMSSYQLQRKSLYQPKVDLAVETELIIYGKVTPGAMVYVQGEPITVNEEGSFSLRYALSDGTLILPIKAVAPNGMQTQTTVPVISRETY